MITTAIKGDIYVVVLLSSFFISLFLILFTIDNDSVGGASGAGAPDGCSGIGTGASFSEVLTFS